MSPSIEPSASPTIEPTTSSPTFSIRSSLKCGDMLKGTTSYAHHIDFYSLRIQTQTDLVLDSCNSTFDTWLFFEDASGEFKVDCDDCGECGLQTQLNLKSVEVGEYIVGVGGYDSHHGEYTLRVSCSHTLPPSQSPTLITTKHPTPRPSERPTIIHPTLEATMTPTEYPSAKPTKKTTQNPTISATASPTMRTTDSLRKITQNPTQYPSMRETDIFLNLSLTENAEQVLNSTQSEESMNGLLIGMIASIVFIALIVAGFYGLKCAHRSGKYHLNIGDDDDEEEEEDGEAEAELDDLDIINLIHCGKRNSVNDLDIDEIVERATIDLMKMTKKENDLDLVITNGQPVTKQ